MRTPPEWGAILDAIEDAIGDRTAAIISGRPLTPAVDLPEDAGPVPAELRARAEALLAALDAQEHALGDELTRIEAELQRVMRTSAAAPRSAADRRRGGFEARV